MNTIKYINFSVVDPEDFIPVLNEEKIRGHLVSHSLFDSQSIKEWVKEKIVSSSMPGCRIRAVYSDSLLAGWCGIQKNNAHYEIAIVISKSIWGAGPIIFRELICWAKELGHKEVVIHLPETRPPYNSLNQISTKTHSTKIFGSNFVTYHISI